MSIYRYPTWLAILFVLGAAQSTRAQEVTLNQTKAISGNITPGDTPGFPITITRPGRYVLTSNLNPTPASPFGIEVKAYDVTIDFNGFILHGGFQQAMGVGIHGGSVNTVKIMNGLIAGFGTALFGRDSWVVENMRISANGFGIYLFDFARVQRNTVTLNSVGIRCKGGCLIEGSVISKNGTGVEIETGNVLGNAITSNAGFGIKAWTISKTPIGFGNNLLYDNNLQGDQVEASFMIPLHPNACVPGC